MKKDLVFQGQLQQQSYWNWAAVAVSIALYYDPNFSQRQCDLANWATGQTKINCCVYGDSAICNQEAKLSKALNHCGNLGARLEGGMRFDQIKNEIDSGKPLCVQITFAGGGSDHNVIITGYDDDGEYISVFDSHYGNINVLFSNFPFNYRSDAEWSDSFLTQPDPRNH